MPVIGFRDLMRRAQAGDRQAIAELFQAALPYVERIVRAHTQVFRPGESVSDRVQDVGKRILEKLAQFRGTPEAGDEQTWNRFRGWVRRIVQTVGVNAGRACGGPRRPYKNVPLEPPAADQSTSHGGTFDPPAAEPTPSANVRASERTRLVLDALNKLPDPINREIVRLRFFEEISLHEIATRLGLTYDIVRERFRVSKRRLQRELEELQ